MAKTTEVETVRFDVLDLPWINQVAKSLSERQKQTFRPRFSAAVDILRKLRESQGWRPTQGIYAPLPADLRKLSDPTAGLFDFVENLRGLGIRPLAFDYRECFGSIPQTFGESAGTDFQHLSSLISYLIGISVGRSTKTNPAEILVVSGSFELYRPLIDVAQRQGKAGLAFFDGHLDGRWIRLARILTTGESPITYTKLQLDDWFETTDSVRPVHARDNGLAAF